MKKNFPLQAPNKKPDRVVEAVKAEVNKYLARERRKSLPEGVDYWDFDCKVGADAKTAQRVHVKELSKSIDEVALRNGPSVYIEILAKHGIRAK
jgi:hypothetical protein